MIERTMARPMPTRSRLVETLAVNVDRVDDDNVRSGNASTAMTAGFASAGCAFRRRSPFRWIAKESLLAAGGVTVDCEPVLLPALQLNEGV
jgi:hypothetical protein